MAAEPRIRQPKKYEDLFSSLISSDSSVFESKAQVLLFSATLGFSENKRVPFSESLEPIRMAIFENLRDNSFQVVLNTLALAETKDISILLDDRLQDRILIFEEYASGGLSIIQEILKSSTSNFDSIVRFLLEQQPHNDESDDTIIQFFNSSV